MTDYDVDGPIRVTIDNATGEITVTTTDAPRAEVEVRALCDDEATREAVAGTRVDLRDGGELVVDVPRRRGSFFDRDPRVGVEVRVPHGSTVRFAAAAAAVELSGRFGEVRGKTASGDVVVGEAETVRVESASGDIRLETARGRVEVRTASGDVEVGRVAGPVEAATVSGGLRVGTAQAGGAFQSVSGDVDVAAVGGDVELRSVSGDVTLGIPVGVGVHVDVTTVSGDLRSDLDLTDAPVDGDGPSVTVRGRTVSGDLHVRRARGALTDAIGT